MEVVRINPHPSLQDSLDVIDALRRDVEAGKVVAFFVAGVDDADAVIGYCSTSKPVSRLRMQGAIAQGLHDFMGGAI